MILSGVIIIAIVFCAFIIFNKQNFKYSTKIEKLNFEISKCGVLAQRKAKRENLTDLGCTDNRHNGVRPVLTLPQTVVPKNTQ